MALALCDERSGASEPEDVADAGLLRTTFGGDIDVLTAGGRL
jgi:hypothetical protein